ncbi:MAG: hypothetical protein HY543_12130 [Deltaproteobacteria bacterium]|nr:hypothetical protein [Deltaproteobacteria bacterium]
MVAALSLFGLWGCGGGGESSDTTSSKAATEEAAGETDIVSSVSDMGKGDIVLLSFSGGSSSLSFSGSQAGMEYQLIVQSTTEAQSTSTLTLGDEGVPIPSLGKALLAEEPPDVHADFEAMLRATEAELADQGALPLPSVGKSIAPAVAVGDTANFRVLKSLTSTAVYSEVAATAKCVTSRVALFVDDVVKTELPDVMSTEDYASLCSKFDDTLKTEFAILGDPPDINGDGSVTVLMTPKVNALGGSGGGIVTGFFFAGDLLGNSSSNPASNQREIVHVLYPDPNGVFGSKLSKDFTMGNLLTAVVPHEVQHLLSYYYHVLVNGGSSEQAWLNEGMSHLIEDVVGYGQENPSREALFLNATAASSVVTSGSPSLTQRGGIYLFMRFLYEQAGSNGSAFLKNLVQANRTGSTNLVQAFGTDNEAFNSLPEFLRRWGVALVATDAGVTTDARYIYKARTKNETTGHWHGVCLVCDAEDGRSTSLAGPTVSAYSSGKAVSLSTTGSALFSISSAPSSITLLGSESTDLQGVLLRTK